MDLLPAYRALVISPEQTRLCAQAATLAELLEQLRRLWSLDAVGDGALISGINRCNQQAFDAHGLEGTWFPGQYHARSRDISWFLPQGHATEPFQDQYIDRCRSGSVFNQLFQPRTSIAPLMSDMAPVGTSAPAGFILHLSRCGSTLLSGCLSELDDTCVLSESPLLTEVLLDASLTDTQKQALLPRLVALQAAPFPGRDRIVVKWNAWDVFLWPLIESAFPGVPRVLLFRDPEEILASHARSPGRHMAIDPALAHLDPAFRTDAVDATLLDMRIGVLRGMMRSMAPLAGAGSMSIDYPQLDRQAMQQACRHFGMVPGPEALARMAARTGFHSKEPGRVFASDGERKRQHFDADERQLIQRELAPGYRRLREASPETHRQP